MVKAGILDIQVYLELRILQAIQVIVEFLVTQAIVGRQEQ
jgi:hypothetical protein